MKQVPEATAGSPTTPPSATPKSPRSQPQYAVTQQTVKLDPVWPFTPLKAAFEIHNKGSAVLRVQAKPG